MRTDKQTHKTTTEILAVHGCHGLIKGNNELTMITITRLHVYTGHVLYLEYGVVTCHMIQYYCVSSMSHKPVATGSFGASSLT